MKIGLLLCDDVKPELQATFKNYPDMFEALLRGLDPDVELQTWRVHDQQLPPGTDLCDGWIISGSQYSVNDGFAWMAQLEDFVRALYIEQRKLIGICFGHQLMARALGGKVTLAAEGWRIGVYDSNLAEQRSWMQPELDTLRLRVSHQEQVTQLPDSTTVLAKSLFCPYFMLEYGQHFLSIQGHPEFTKEYTETLILSRKHIIPANCVTQGIESLHQPESVYSNEVGRWMLNFFGKPLH